MTADTSAAPAQNPTVIAGTADLLARVGSDLGVSPWISISQDQITAFAGLTNDNQWIHVDPERAKDGPFGTTVVHGFFTLSLFTGLLEQAVRVDGVSAIINMGLNKVRFPSPVKVDSRIRMQVKLGEAVEFEGGVQVVYHVTYEVEGAPKPGCVAQVVFRYYS